MYSASNSTESSQSSELLRSLVRAITNTNETLKLIHQDLAVKRLDPEKIRKTVKESVVPAIHFLRDEDGQCSPMVFIRYLSELRSALKDYGYEQVCANFAEQKYDSVSDEEELFTNETLKLKQISLTYNNILSNRSYWDCILEVYLSLMSKSYTTIKELDLSCL
ncbi:hypothetical protein AWRI1499_2923 [Brettanomyces bruxellensis AWRI1499]|nr:hypothetical protein AWRI1499_2923 [Brettanomyces bruxellensis AWRI1499]